MKVVNVVVVTVAVMELVALDVIEDASSSISIVSMIQHHLAG